jgi:hypothetical protein
MGFEASVGFGLTVAGWESSSRGRFHDARRFPLYTIVARTRMYTYAAAKVRDLSIVQGPFSVGLCHSLTLRIRIFFVAVQRGCC